MNMFESRVPKWDTIQLQSTSFSAIPKSTTAHPYFDGGGTGAAALGGAVPNIGGPLGQPVLDAIAL